MLSRVEHARMTDKRGRTGRRPAEDIEGSEIAGVGTAQCTGPAQEAWLQMREITHPPGLLEAGGKLAAELGVTPGAIRALRPLAGAGTITMSGLAGQLRCDGSYVTSLIDTLEEAGLAERRNDPHDRRVKVVALTEKGRKVARRAQKVIFAPPPGFSALSPGELDQLVALLRKIRQAQTPQSPQSPRSPSADAGAIEPAP